MTRLPIHRLLPGLVIAFALVAGFIVTLTLERPWWQSLLAAVVVALAFRVGYELFLWLQQRYRKDAR
jgi:uncharacterized BrkB/YihY/UPF0761 family membrane protein